MFPDFGMNGLIPTTISILALTTLRIIHVMMITCTGYLMQRTCVRNNAWMHFVITFMNGRRSVRFSQAYQDRSGKGQPLMGLFWLFDRHNNSGRGETELGRQAVIVFVRKNSFLPSCVSLPCLFFVSYALRTVCLRHTLLCLLWFCILFFHLCSSSTAGESVANTSSVNNYRVSFCSIMSFTSSKSGNVEKSSNQTNQSKAENTTECILHYK